MRCQSALQPGRRALINIPSGKKFSSVLDLKMIIEMRLELKDKQIYKIKYFFFFSFAFLPTI